jgi:hypothetical protein
MALNPDNAGSLVVRPMLPSVSAANTAAATSGAGFWIDTQDLEGSIVVLVAGGAVTGSVTGKLQSATDVNGTGAADLTGYTFAAISTANQAAALTIPKTALTNRYLGFVGTVVTGPVLLAVVAVGSKKYS